MPVAKKLADKLHDGVVDIDKGLLSELGNAYGKVAQALDAEITKLAAKIDAARAAGETVNAYWVHQAGRLATLRNEAQTQLDKYATVAEDAITEAQQKAVDLAQEDATALMREGLGDPPKPGIEASFTKLPTNAIDNLVGRANAGDEPTHLSRALGRYSDDIAKRMEHTLVTGLARGRGPESIARELRGIAGGGFYQHLRLARTEVLTSYRAASLKTYEANSAVVDEWEWVTAEDELVCPFCSEMDGQRFPIDTEFETHPNCRCSPAPVTKSWDELLADIAAGDQDAAAAVDGLDAGDGGDEDQAAQDAARAREDVLAEDQNTTERLGNIQSEIDSLIGEYRALAETDNPNEERLAEILASKSALQAERFKLEDERLDRLRAILAVDDPAKFRVFGADKAVNEFDVALRGFSNLVSDKAIGLTGTDREVGIVSLPRGSRPFYSERNIPLASGDNSLHRGVYLAVGERQDQAVHELGHWLEHGNPDIAAQVRDFVAKRTAGEELQPLRDITGNNFYGPEEVARPDKFINPYMGKDYGGRPGSSEIVSMGLEYMYQNPAKLAAEDPEYFDFIHRIVRGK